MSATSKQILFPPGRLVQGSLYRAQDKDMDGNPKVFPPGHAKAGQLNLSYYFAVAYPKTTGGWWETPWGKEITEVGFASWPNGQAKLPDFAWKVEDGDSDKPKKGKGPESANKFREGMPGHWIVNFKSGFAPKVFVANDQGSMQPLVEPDVVKLGYWVEVAGTVQSNESTNTPGVYINHNMVCFRGRDKEIFTGADPNAVGFGRAALPSHVSMAPVASGSAQVPAVAPTPTPSPTAGLPALAVRPAAAPAAPIQVTPHAPFIAPPVAGAGTPVVPAAPAIPPAPAAPQPPAADPMGAPAGYRMVKADGSRYEAFKAAGWSDDQLLANGHMVKL